MAAAMKVEEEMEIMMAHNNQHTGIANRSMFTSSIVLIPAAILIMSTGAFATVVAHGQQLQQQQSGSSNGISILSSSLLRPETGSVYVVGEVRNDLPYAVEYVQIVGRFFDSSGRLIDTDFTYTHLDQLRPGEESPFKLILTDESTNQNIATYDLSVNGDRVYGSGLKPEGLRVQVGDQRINDYGWYEIVGEVQNAGTQNTQYVKAIATFYNDAGTVIETDFTYTRPSDLAAGQSAPFEITMTDEDVADDIASVKITAESDDYFMIASESEQQQPQEQGQSQGMQQEQQEGTLTTSPPAQATTEAPPTETTSSNNNNSGPSNTVDVAVINQSTTQAITYTEQALVAMQNNDSQGVSKNLDLALTELENIHGNLTLSASENTGVRSSDRDSDTSAPTTQSAPSTFTPVL
jgi:hypothetical protein